MQSACHVAVPPAKPVMIYDGECRFCYFWILRWRQVTKQQVEYIAFQDPSVATRFPEVPRERLVSAVHLIQSDGSVVSGAEAAFRALAYHRKLRWLTEWYADSPFFARVTEATYRFVASHRPVFSLLTRLGWGKQIEPGSHQMVRWVFLRSLGIVYLIAFLSLWVQIMGLIGSNGILPAKLSMEAMRQHAAAQQVGFARFHLLPTLCWINASDAFLNFQCGAGAVLAALLILGFAPAPCLFLLWGLYLSLSTICSEFLGFQWDNLLLEAGFLAIFLAPLQLLPSPTRAPPPSRIVRWLFRLLLFKLMFQSGCVKLLSGDAFWRDLTALTVHYETQPLPTWVAWYTHQLPLWWHKTSTILMFAVELVIPFLIFAPRRLRHFACAALLGLQMAIFLTGNYCFFNLLTMALCLLLLDDAALIRFIPIRWRDLVRSQFSAPSPSDSSNPPFSPSGEQPLGRRARFRPVAWPIQVTVPLFCIALLITLMQLLAMFQVRAWPRLLIAMHQGLLPLRTFNSYGLFAVMTTTRPEIIIQGSNDGAKWLDYEFKYKPGELKRRPAFVEPHQPRLDWQMWFAALGSYARNPWLVNFCVRLLQGSPEVLQLMKHNPFYDSPPRYIRAVLYEYHFTDFASRRQSGEWWRREFKGVYLPVISVQDIQQPSRQ